MKSSPLVTLIVPIFNVEKFLIQCINSIINQTYKNIEIILVNDGSSDSSGKIANNFAKDDERISVFHIENKGVSAARNLGINEATGEYIVFVDSDDYLLPDFIEYMLKITDQTKAEFCISTNVFTSENMNQVAIDSIDVYSREQATCAFLYPGIKIGCWNKIFKRDFLVSNNIRFFTELFMGEGLNFITTASQFASKVGVGHRKVYFYRTDNVNSATKKFDINKINNAIKAIEYIENNLIIKTNNILIALEFSHFWTRFYALKMIHYEVNKNRYLLHYYEYSEYLKNNALKVLFRAKVSKITKIKIFCIFFTPKYSLRSFVWLKKNFSTLITCIINI